MLKAQGGETESGGDVHPPTPANQWKASVVEPSLGFSAQEEAGRTAWEREDPLEPLANLSPALWGGGWGKVLGRPSQTLARRSSLSSFS